MCTCVSHPTLWYAHIIIIIMSRTLYKVFPPLYYIRDMCECVCTSASAFASRERRGQHFYYYHYYYFQYVSHMQYNILYYYALRSRHCARDFILYNENLYIHSDNALPAEAMTSGRRHPLSRGPRISIIDGTSNIDNNNMSYTADYSLYIIYRYTYYV